jgi:hypothetical protein
VAQQLDAKANRVSPSLGGANKQIRRRHQNQNDEAQKAERNKTMDNELKQYCDRLQAEAKIAETCLARVAQHLVSPESTPLANWKTLLQEATTQCAAKREPAQQAGQRVKVWMEEMEKGARTPFDDANLDGEVTKAENQADKEAGLAMDAMVVAAHAILQAEVALLRAFSTHKTAFDLARFRKVF